MFPRFSVRRMRVRDLDRILEIERASFGPDAYERNLFAEYFRKCGELFLTAERQESIWGYMIVCTRGDRAEIASVAVDPAVRGQGAASALMESALRRLLRRGTSRLSLMVRVTNREAQAYYNKYGFQKVRRVRGYYEDGSDGFLMSRVV